MGGAGAAGATADTMAVMGEMNQLTELGMMTTIQTAMMQLKMALAAALANIMKTVGSNIEDASRKG
jgi:phage-related minor tail protein